MNQQRKPAAFPLERAEIGNGVPAASSERQRGATGVPSILISRNRGRAVEGPREAPRRRRRRMAWGSVLVAALSGLLVLGMALAAARLIDDLFARSDALGYLGLGLAGLAATAFAALVIRETTGLIRLHAVERLRERAQQAIASDDREKARAVVHDVIGIERIEPRLARARGEMQAHLGQIIDGADLIRLAERKLMTPLDDQARQMVTSAARRVSIVTAVSPRAVVDVLFVVITVFALIRRLADLYGARPGAIGRIRLFRLALAHLAMTGGMAAGDSLIQQALGHGVAAKISARLGEGVLNGLLTARLGLAAIEVTRPLPFVALPRPKLLDLTADLLKRPVPPKEMAEAP